MNSFENFFANKSVLIEFGDVLAIVDFVSAWLSKWHDETFAKAAEYEHCHDAEVEDHGAVSVHLFDTRDIILFMMSWHYDLSSIGLLNCWCLSQEKWSVAPLNDWSQLHVAFDLNWDHWLSSGNHNLSELIYTVFHCSLGCVELVPETFLNLTHVGPGIHPIGLNIRETLLILFLLLGVSLDILLQISLLWVLDNYWSDLLWSLYFISYDFFLEALLNDIGEAHVVYFLRCSYFGLRNWALTLLHIDLWLLIKINLFISLLLDEVVICGDR